MIRLLLIALLAAATPADAQPTPAERARMAGNVEALLDSLSDARAASDRVPGGADRSSARAAARSIEARLDAAEDDLARADAQIAESNAAPLRAARVAPPDDSPAERGAPLG